MFQETAGSGGCSVDVTPDLEDANGGRRGFASGGLGGRLHMDSQPEAERLSAKPAASQKPLASPISPGIAIGGLRRRNRHTSRLCVACEAPLGSQDAACWRCGSRWADRQEQRAEPERQIQSDSDRWTDEGGGLVMEESSSSTSPTPIPPADRDWALGTSVPSRVSRPDAAEPLPKLARQMSANVVFQVHDGRGAELLAKLEERTSHRSTVTPSGDREYELSAAEVGVDGFDPILGLIDTGWRDHLSRTQLPTT